MSNKILAIKEIRSAPLVDYGEGEGYSIQTEEQEIKILVSNSQQCCELWGHIASQDDLKYFVGSEFIKAEIVKKDMSIIDLSDVDNGDVFDAVFLNITTSLGVFQLVVYSSHNGYYGHRINVFMDNKVWEL